MFFMLHRKGFVAMKLIYFTLLLVLFLQPLTLAQVANVSALAHEANMENYQLTAKLEREVSV